MLNGWIFQKKPDIPALARRRDIAGLIRALSSKDPSVQSAAARALGTMGPEAAGPLVHLLKKRDQNLRLGAISALGGIRDPGAGAALGEAIHDPVSEVRWQAAVALGETGCPAAIAPLLAGLDDRDKYVRYAAAVSLTALGWKPDNAGDHARYYAALQEWDAVRQIGGPAVAALTGLLRDRDGAIRVKAVELLGATGENNAVPAIMQSLADEDREVRWAAAVAARKCSIPMKALPRGLSRRPRKMKNPWIAGFLNFLLPGLGYGYLGKWWGIIIFQIDITLTVWLFSIEGKENSYTLLLPLYSLLGVHAWYIASRIPPDPP